MATAKREGQWFRCDRCRHKLGKAVGVWGKTQALPAIEIKCHSCGELNYIMIGGAQKNERT